MCVDARRWQGPTPERIALVIEVKGPWNGELLTSQRKQLAKRYGVVSLCASAAGWVQMRCRECAAEVAVTARVCSGCGAPNVGQAPVVADTVVADTAARAVSDAAGKAVPAGVAEKALREPYVPGSGDRGPCGVSAGAGRLRRHCLLSAGGSALGWPRLLSLSPSTGTPGWPSRWRWSACGDLGGPLGLEALEADIQFWQTALSPTAAPRVGPAGLIDARL